MLYIERAFKGYTIIELLLIVGICYVASLFSTIAMYCVIGIIIVKLIWRALR